MKHIYVDIDGVVRQLSNSVVEERTGIKNFDTKVWFWKIGDKDIFDFVAEDFTVLERCKPTKYYSTIHKFSRRNPITFLTCQPKEWISHTSIWMDKHFPDSEVMYFETSTHKIKYFSGVVESGIDGYLIEDYPFKGLPDTTMQRIVMIAYPYNREVEGCCRRVTSPKQLQSMLNGLTKGDNK